MHGQLWGITPSTDAQVKGEGQIKDQTPFSSSTALIWNHSEPTHMHTWKLRLLKWSSNPSYKLPSGQVLLHWDWTMRCSHHVCWCWSSGSTGNQCESRKTSLWQCRTVKIDVGGCWGNFPFQEWGLYVDVTTCEAAAEMGGIVLCGVLKLSSWQLKSMVPVFICLTNFPTTRLCVCTYSYIQACLHGLPLWYAVCQFLLADTVRLMARLPITAWKCDLHCYAWSGHLLV